MKKIQLYYLVFSLFPLLFINCSSNDFPDYTKPRPAWTVPEASYSSTMTAIVSLAPILEEDADANDLFAAFIGDECRAIAEMIESNGKRYYFFVIKGFSRETQDGVKFRYYSSKRSYLYESDSVTIFTPDLVWGVIDEPKTPDLYLIQ